MSEMTHEQINRNFIAVNEWMKLERKRVDGLVHENEKLRRDIATLTGRMTELESKMGVLAARHFGHGSTV